MNGKDTYIKQNMNIFQGVIKAAMQGANERTGGIAIINIGQMTLGEGNGHEDLENITLLSSDDPIKLLTDGVESNKELQGYIKSLRNKISRLEAELRVAYEENNKKYSVRDNLKRILELLPDEIDKIEQLKDLCIDVAVDKFEGNHSKACRWLGKSYRWLTIRKNKINKDNNQGE